MSQHSRDLVLGQSPRGYRSGFVSVVGRPNAGKSTLVNQIVHAKVAITSDRPQTTRNAIRGVLTTDQAQVIFVDTPGLHKPRTTLGERLNQVVHRTLKEVDCVVWVLDGSEPIGRGDAFMAEQLQQASTPVIAVVNKIDLLDRRTIETQLDAVRALGPPGEVIEVSARIGAGVPELVRLVVGTLPEGPLFYPPDLVTDQPERVLVSELIREKVLGLMREEVPHSVAVVVEEMAPRDDDGDEPSRDVSGLDDDDDEDEDEEEAHLPSLVDIDAIIYVERESQKGMVIGKKGRVLKEVGTEARKDIEALLGSHVYLRLRVKVERDWQKRTGMITRFGYGQ